MTFPEFLIISSEPLTLGMVWDPPVMEKFGEATQRSNMNWDLKEGCVA